MTGHLEPSSSIVCATQSVEQTQAIAGIIAVLAADGDLLVLVGDLGAGKTHFTQGFARARGVTDPVTSPTFTLANRYEGDLVINHLDAYRVEELIEAEDLALPELLEDGVTLIEWGDLIRPALPADLLEVRITLGDGDDDRRIELSAIGTGWSSRLGTLRARLADWTDS
ncbi:MAG: tRNA (adenosine(37)-N6)-threonylcarbamoyltransferase complex ATPase subunit type 1 TsaE [Actinomycetota bacterium]